MIPDSNAACRELRDDISAYVDGDLPAVECHRIERHCRDCQDCAALIDGLRRTIGLCRDVGRAPLPEAIRDRARARVRQLLAEHDPIRASRRK